VLPRVEIVQHYIYDVRGSDPGQELCHMALRPQHRGSPWHQILNVLAVQKPSYRTGRSLRRVLQHSAPFCRDDALMLLAHRIATVTLSYGLDGRGSIPAGFRPAAMLTQPHNQWIPGALSPVVKQPGSEPDHSYPSSAEVKNAWSYTSTSYTFLHGVLFT
jgi:hypothetical protein